MVKGESPPTSAVKVARVGAGATRRDSGVRGSVRAGTREGSGEVRAGAARTARGEAERGPGGAGRGPDVGGE